MVAKYVPPTDAQLARIGSSREVTEQLHEGAIAAADYAATISPRVSGYYAGEWTTLVEDGDVYIVNEAEYAASVEWGNNDIPDGHHIGSQVADWMEP